MYLRLTRELGLNEDLARLWLDACYPAQVMLVLGMGELASSTALKKYQLGMQGIRGMKPGSKTKLVQHRALLRQSEVERARLAAMPQLTDQGRQALLDEFM